jgi:hypothetical protein
LYFSESMSPLKYKEKKRTPKGSQKGDFMITQNSKKINRFWLGNVRKELQTALEQVKMQTNKIFPKNESRWLSQYKYKNRKIRFHKDGFICGGTIRLLFILIDFSFIRNILADCYSAEGGLVYDPVTMFVLEIIKLWEGSTYYTDFYKTLRDPIKGNMYREYAGISDRIPDDVDMHNFRKRIGEERFQAVMGMLVELFKIVGIISGHILCTDGTLIESFANFRGCNYMDNCCKCLDCPSGLFQEVNAKIEEACLLIDAEDKRSKMITVDMQCPIPEVIEKMKEALKNKKKKVADCDVGRFSVLKIKINRNPPKGWENNVKLLSSLIGIEIFVPNGYGIEVISSVVSLDENNKLKYSCPKACKDIEARTGYRRDRNNPNKLEPVFGYKAVIMTSVEIELDLEIPIMVSTGSGNITEAEHFLKAKKKLKEYASFETKYHIMDSGYDYLYVYEHIRKDGAVPIIDYNYRNEKLTKEALKDRGYDEIGRPYAPCGKLCTPNGYDPNRASVKYMCGKGCEACKTCEHARKKYGYTKSMAIKDTPKVTIEVPRCSKRYKQIKNIRSSSERTNSYTKQWSGLSNLRLLGKVSYAVRAILVCIVTMLKKITEFIEKMTLYYKNPAIAVKIYGEYKENLKRVF